MRTLKLTTVVVATALCAMSCGKKAENDSKAAEKAETVEKAENAAAVDEGAATEATGGEVSEIINIKNLWQEKTIAVEPAAAATGIRQFALAFCGQFPEYEPNRFLREYLQDPKGYDREATGYFVEVNDRNGFAFCRFMAEYSTDVDCCYWKCDNGHCLVAFWLVEEHENDVATGKAALFYDYDPATGKMSPRPEWTVMIENAVKAADDYNITLPEEGKDIIITKFTDSGDDSYDSTSQTMKWNGQGFTLR